MRPAEDPVPDADHQDAGTIRLRSRSIWCGAFSGAHLFAPRVFPDTRVIPSGSSQQRHQPDAVRTEEVDRVQSIMPGIARHMHCVWYGTFSTAGRRSCSVRRPGGAAATAATAAAATTATAGSAAPAAGPAADLANAAVAIARAHLRRHAAAAHGVSGRVAQLLRHCHARRGPPSPLHAGARRQDRQAMRAGALETSRNIGKAVRRMEGMAQACWQDIQTHCSGSAGGSILQCMIDNRASLSGPCQAMVVAQPAARRGRARCRRQAQDSMVGSPSTAPTA